MNKDERNKDFCRWKAILELTSLLLQHRKDADAVNLAALGPREPLGALPGPRLARRVLVVDLEELDPFGLVVGLILAGQITIILYHSRLGAILLGGFGTDQRRCRRHFGVFE